MRIDFQAHVVCDGEELQVSAERERAKVCCAVYGPSLSWGGAPRCYDTYQSVYHSRWLVRDMPRSVPTLSPKDNAPGGGMLPRSHRSAGSTSREYRRPHSITSPKTLQSLPHSLGIPGYVFENIRCMGFAYTAFFTLLGVVEGRSCVALNAYPRKSRHPQTVCIAVDVKGVAPTYTATLSMSVF